MAHPERNKLNYLNAGLFLVIIFSGLTLYFVPLHSTSFYFDDQVSIVLNTAIKTVDVPRIFNTFNTRFLVGLSFALNYKLCALDPAGYRLTNLLIHCLNAFLVYLLIKLIGRRHQLSAAFFGSMLFLCHPIQTEPVNFITQRFVLMGSFFYLATLVLYIKSRKAHNNTFYYISSLITAMAAMFCKEFVVTLPVMLAVYEFYFLSALADTWQNRCSRLLPFFVIVLIVPILLLRMPSGVSIVANIAESHFIQTDSTQKGIKHIDITRDYSSFSRKQYFLTELNVVCTYIRLLFLPVNQNFDYDYPISSHMDAKTALCGAFLLGLLALAAVTYKTYRIVSFSILWFFIALSVESSFIPIGHVIAEYRLYLASVGFVLLVTALIYMRKAGQKPLNMIAAAILIVFSILTYQRNRVWKDEIILWNDTIQKSPYKARPYLSRGWLYYTQGNLTQASADYDKAIELNPKYAEAYFVRGFAFYSRGNSAQAMSDYNKAIDIDPRFAKAYYNRALVYHNQGHLSQAMPDYNKAIDIDPNFADAHNNRGWAYYTQGKSAQAIADFNKAIEIDPGYARAYFNRGIAYYKEGNLVQAASDFGKAIAIEPGHAYIYYNRGLAYYMQGKFTQAVSDYNKAIELDPDYAKPYNSRATAYYR